MWPKKEFTKFDSPTDEKESKKRLKVSEQVLFVCLQNLRALSRVFFCYLSSVGLSNFVNSLFLGYLLIWSHINQNLFERKLIYFGKNMSSLEVIHMKWLTLEQEVGKKF
jgi:hypothetical protein